MALAQDGQAAAQVQAIAGQELARLRTRLTAQAPASSAQKAHFAYAIERIRSFQDPGRPAPPARRIDPPPGMPIGMEEDFCSLIR